MSEEENATAGTSDTEPVKTDITEIIGSELIEKSDVEAKESGNDSNSKTPMNEKAIVEADFEFAVEEGVEIDADSLAGLKNFSIEHNLSKDSAQALLDHLISARSKAMEAQKAANEKAIAEAVKKIKADPDIGGSKYDEIQSAADRITLKYGGSDFQKAVSDGGLKSEPMFLRFIRNLNSSLTEDEVISTSQTRKSGPKEKTFEEYAKEFINNDT